MSRLVFGRDRAPVAEPFSGDEDLYIDAQFLLLRDTCARPANAFEGMAALEEIDNWLADHPISRRVLLAGLDALRDDQEVQDYINAAAAGDDPAWEDG